MHEPLAGDQRSGLGRMRTHPQQSWKKPQRGDPFGGFEGSPETRSPQVPKSESQLRLAAGTGMANVGKGVGSCLAGRAAVEWMKLRRRKRKKTRRSLVSEWLTLERGERSVVGAAEMKACEEELIWPCWPLLHHCHEHCERDDF